MNQPKLINTGEVSREAEISDCGQYRWWLARLWDHRPLVCWIMLNPSTADASIDDPTIRRCIAFSKAWGYGGMLVVNLFAFRATDPRQLKLAADPIGEQCNIHLDSAVRRCSLTIAAWGNHGAFQKRGRNVALMCEVAGLQLHCLGLTNDGHPKHPLARGRHRVPDDAQPIPFKLPEARR